MKLVVFGIDLAVHISIADLKEAKALEVFASGDGLAGFLHLVEELVPQRHVSTQF